MTRDRDELVLDTTHAERYDPLELSRQDNVGIALTRVHTPEDALRFAQRFGLLTQPGGPMGKRELLPPVLREPLATFERAAENLRRIVRTV